MPHRARRCILTKRSASASWLLFFISGLLKSFCFNFSDLQSSNNLSDVIFLKTVAVMLVLQTWVRVQRNRWRQRRVLQHRKADGELQGACQLVLEKGQCCLNYCPSHIVFHDSSVYVCMKRAWISVYTSVMLENWIHTRLENILLGVFGWLTLDVKRSLILWDDCQTEIVLLRAGQCCTLLQWDCSMGWILRAGVKIFTEKMLVFKIAFSRFMLICKSVSLQNRSLFWITVS